MTDLPYPPRTESPWVRLMAGEVRRHWVFALLMAAGLTLRVLVSFAYQPALEFYGDSYGYLSNASNLVPGPDHPAGYSIFLRFLSWSGSLAAVTIVQHLLGLAIALVLYILLLRLGLPRWGAGLAVAPVLLDAYQLDIEQFIMAETLVEVLVVVGFAILLWRHHPSMIACAASGVVLSLAGITRVVAFGLLPLGALFLLVRRLGWQRLAAFGVAAALIPIVYAGWYDSAHRQFSVTGESGIFLYGRVAQFANCRGLSLPASERPLCERTPPSERSGPNYYVWNGKSPLNRLHHVTEQQRNSLADDFAKRVILHQPATYLDVATVDTLHYFALGHPIGTRDWPVQTWQFPEPHRPKIFHSWLANSGFDGRHVTPVYEGPIAGWLRAYQRIVYTPGPLLGICLFLGLGGVLYLAARTVLVLGRLLGELWSGIAPEGAEAVRASANQMASAVVPLTFRLHAGGLVLGLAGLALVALPSLTTGFDYRYGLLALPLLPAAGALGTTLAWRAVRTPYNRREVETLAELLTERDRLVVGTLHAMQGVSSREVADLHFRRASQAEATAMRAARRALARLQKLGLVERLDRTATRRRSNSFIYTLSPLGERLFAHEHRRLGPVGWIIRRVHGSGAGI